MSAVEGLHPTVAHHLVNTLGWSRLRPLQEAAIAPLVEGEHALLLAPTASGKTEAAVMPLLSRMLEENWRGLSVLYVCPIKALLNDLEHRLRHYAALVGRRVARWHGDVGDAERRRIVREPPDLLLTTPESIEVMLVSRRTDPRAFFARVRAVVVDEIHAFAGDDRGWHLLSVLARVERLAGGPVQRVGLSATVGNHEELLNWLAGSAPGRRRVIAPPAAARAEPDLELDHVGSLDNAALVISRLHRGEKRLVFCDSRARVEKLAVALEELGVKTFVSHSSLSRDQRARAELAFAEGDDCVIVATSTLELGIDVGDLDRVIQIDAPPSVSSLLQRMGRTGRRSGDRSNCLILATTEPALVRASALLVLLKDGFIEPVEPPVRPLHVFAQQVMALALQEGGLSRGDWRHWLLSVPGFAAVPERELEDVLSFMLESGILFSDQGILWFGEEGEKAFGRRNFMEVLSVITSAPLFRVLFGREELGTVDQSAVLLGDGVAHGLLLAGRAWDVRSIDYRRRLLYVQPTKRRGRSLWVAEGEGWPMRFEHAQTVRRVLSGEVEPPGLSRRGRDVLAEARLAHAWLDRPGTVLTSAPGKGVAWWTFAGWLANAALADALRGLTEIPIHRSDLSIRFETEALPSALVPLIDRLRQLPPSAITPTISDKAVDGLKFSSCLPRALAIAMLRHRWADEKGLQWVLSARAPCLVDPENTAR